ncbi:MAG: hypothetical protein AAF383_17545 [Cyanobacteria bacterium P01_A01_bin.83]
MPKGVPLGPRVTVAVGKRKDGKAIYSYMLEKNAKLFGFSTEKKTPTRKSKKGIIIPIRGSKGTKHIKIPIGDKKTTKGSQKYAQVPMPGSMTIPKISAFLSKATKNKPKYFVSDDGIQHPIG